MSVFQSFQTGLALGQQQRKERDATQARASASELFKAGNYEGAETGLMAAGLYDEAQAFGSAGVRRRADEKQKAQGQAYKTGGWTGLMDVAGAEGDFQTVATAQQMVDAGTQRERQTKTWAKEDYLDGMGQLARSAREIMDVPEEGRKDAALAALQGTPYEGDQTIISAIERAAADGRITNFELEQFEQQMLTAQDRMAQENWQATFDQGVKESDRSYDLDVRKTKAAEAAAMAEAGPPVPELGDIKGIRETNEKRFQSFEESQRAYQSMAGLAQQGTGAADIALGFAFFKTFDPNSTVREGEFAQAAGAMGLGDRAVSIFARLDKGEQFTPQLRAELVQAAGVAYNNQVQDIQGLVERERAFAGRYNINPDDIARDPVRRAEAPQIPEPAMRELLSDPSIEAQREFDETFGPGAARRALGSAGNKTSRSF